MQTAKGRAQFVALWITTGLLAAVVGLSGLSKLTTSGEWDRLFVSWGYPAWLALVIGGLEVAGAAALLARRTAVIGAGVLATIMLGAVATLVTHPGSHYFRGRQAPISTTEPIIWFALLLAVGAVRWRQQRTSLR